VGRQSILVIEDEPDILELVRYNLAKEGFAVSGAETGEEGLAEARARPPDLVLLDLMLPGMDGLEVCRALRADPLTRAIPVVILTARGEETDIVAGLELGADDYVVKPFSPRVLAARVRSVLRRRPAALPAEAAQSPVRIHDLVIHPGRHEVLVRGRAVAVTATEFRLLHYLARHPGWVFTRGQIMREVGGEDYAVTERAVDVQIHGLRGKLGEPEAYIETVRGVGYRFRE
jgi:two-component system phosphate regulon response regulator PhoB